VEVLVADRLPVEGHAGLARRGHEVRMEPELTPDELPAALGAAEVLVVRSTRVTRAALAAGPRLRAVIRAGAGTNTIDVAAASARGVAVCNVPGRNAAAVAELTLGLILSLDRELPDAVADLRQGRWRKARYSHARGLASRSLGIVGLGAVGRAVAERAAPFGPRLHGLDKPDRDPAVTARCRELGMRMLPDLGELAGRCDVLTFHVPTTPDTRGLIGRELLARVPEGALIINTSRGDLVDTDALLEAMDAKGVRAALDAFDREPTEGEADFDHPLAAHPNVYATPHIGASTQQAQQAVTEGVVELVDDLARGRLPSCVNADALAPTTVHEPATT
jgi:D-3-phosphoglycerate dehydrogenase